MERKWPPLRLYRFFLLVVALVIVRFYWDFPFQTDLWKKSTISTSVSSGYTGNVTRRCELPVLDVFGPHIAREYYPKLVDCGKNFLSETVFPGIAFTVENGHQLHQEVNMTLLGLNCCFRTFARLNDGNNTHSNCLPINRNVTIIPTHGEFIEVLCSHGNPEKTPVKYQDAFALVSKEKLNTIRSKLPEDNSWLQWLPGKRLVPLLNVVIIGLDATTRLNFLRQMPLSNDFLLRKLGAISLDGFSVIGIGSQKNLVPLLTGLSFAKFTRTFGKYEYIDNGPYIWREFAKRGYVTSFAEDWTNFNNHWERGFKDPPTTYYFRPYLKLMETLLSSSSNPCFGPRLSIEVVLKYLSDVQRVAEEVNRPYFQFGWTARISHSNHPALAPADVPLLLYLQRFLDTGAFSNTALVIMGDHGFFSTDAGKMEYKWPLAYIVLPPWFANQFPEEYKNLQHNAKRMTTAYDLHATLEDLVDLSKLIGPSEKKNVVSTPGISLFRQIPPSRGCLQAGIALQWCHFCHPSIPLQENSALVQVALPEIVNRINQLVQGHSICRTQSLRRLNKALKWDPRDVLLEICNVNAEDDVGIGYLNATTRQLNISCDPENELVDVVELEFQTNPADATYNVQAVIVQKKEIDLEEKKSSPKNPTVKVFPMSDMVRVDTYRESGSCVEHVLKPYCICRKSFYYLEF